MPPARGIGIFNESHVAEIILYIRGNPGCTRMDIYRNVARGDRMSRKVMMLISMGIVSDGGSPFLSLTDAGMSVADHLSEVESILSDIDGASPYPPSSASVGARSLR